MKQSEEVKKMFIEIKLKWLIQLVYVFFFVISEFREKVSFKLIGIICQNHDCVTNLRNSKLIFQHFGFIFDETTMKATRRFVTWKLRWRYSSFLLSDKWTDLIKKGEKIKKTGPGLLRLALRLATSFYFHFHGSLSRGHSVEFRINFHLHFDVNNMRRDEKKKEEETLADDSDNRHQYQMVRCINATTCHTSITMITKKNREERRKTFQRNCFTIFNLLVTAATTLNPKPVHEQRKPRKSISNGKEKVFILNRVCFSRWKGRACVFEIILYSKFS